MEDLQPDDISLDASRDPTTLSSLRDNESAKQPVLMGFEELIGNPVLIFVKIEESYNIGVVDVSYRESNSSPEREIVAASQDIESFSGVMDVGSVENEARVFSLQETNDFEVMPH